MTPLQGRITATIGLFPLLASAVLAGGFAEPVTPAVAPPEPAAGSVGGVFDGAYTGLSLGYAFGGDDDVGVRGGALDGTQKIGSLDLAGALGGVQAGYRWARAFVLFGVELGVTGGDISDSFDTDAGSASTELRYEASLRGSIGRELNRETLLYGFAGVSQAAFDYTATGPDGADIDEDFNRTGYLLGFGLERALNDRWSLRGEYRYSNYGKETLTDDAGHKTEATPKFNVVTLGVNRLF